ncbi:MAG TPA: hypothetical protein VIT65_26470 [Microlunatus sp.]
MVEGTNQLTSAELETAVGRMADRLVGRGLRRGERVALDALNGVLTLTPTAVAPDIV